MSNIIDLNPSELAARLQQGTVTLIDVREPHEHADERIDGALLMPLSSFDPAAVPQDPARPVVFHCARGGRSANALALCQQAGLKLHTHLAGGLGAWKSAGLPTRRQEAPPGLITRLFGR